MEIRSSSSWSFSYNKIKGNYETSYKTIQTAFMLEEQNRFEEAFQKYKEGIQLIDIALSVEVTCPPNPDSTWEEAIIMIQKMKKTRGEALSRITSIQISNDFKQIEQPPSYEEAVASLPTETLHTYKDLANALNDMSVETVDSKSTIEGRVIYMYENVKLYFISSSEEVASTLKPQTLKIIVVENEGENVPRSIMLIGSWIYPLIPGVSPCYRSNYGVFILPNIYVETPGAYVGIILPPEADEDAYNVLESVLYGIVGEIKKPKLLSEKISDGIVSGASYVSRHLVRGAGKVEKIINKNTSKFVNNTQSAETPTKIPRKVAKGMHKAERATQKAVNVTGYVAKQVGVATIKLGHFLAPHLKKQGTRLLTTGLRMSEENANAKIIGVITVASGAIEGFATVYNGLENSAFILGRSLKDNTVKVVQHKYGDSAGEFADDTLSTVENILTINENTKVFRPKYLAKQTIKETEKSMKNKNIGAANTTGTEEFISEKSELEKK